MQQKSMHFLENWRLVIPPNLKRAIFLQYFFMLVLLLKIYVAEFDII